MNYKRFIKSREIRSHILRWLRFIPDNVMLRTQYWIKTGRKLSLKVPKRYTEKIQWYKLHWKNPLMVECVDKYDVRDYVERKGFRNILTTCYGVYDNVEAIDYNSLPQKFVVKDTLAGGGTSVMIVKDKESLDWVSLKMHMNKWLQRPIVKGGGREWPYYNGKKHRIIIEEYLEDQSDCGLQDYKFLCFGGKVCYVQIMMNRELGTCKMKEGILTPDFKLLPVCGVDHDRMSTSDYIKPANYQKMLDVAEELSKDFPHARIDLYNVSGRIVFGEITFFPASGYKQYIPDSFDLELGKEFVLPKKIKNTSC